MTDQSIFNKLKSSLRRWQIGEYMRQLSVVILGIVITFAGSDLIGKITARKQLSISMQMVLNELEENQQILKELHDMVFREYHVTKYFSEQLEDFSSIPADTLERYKDFFTSSRSFSFSDNAIEALKASGAMQHTNSPELLNELFSRYDELQVIERMIDTYHCGKTQRMESFVAGMTLPQILQIRAGNTLCFWSLFLENDPMRNLSLNTGYTQELLAGSITVSEKVSRTIELLRRKYP